jgi:signal transduction histidine kinase
VGDLGGLRASRARLAEAAQADRRRLERALHDGVQQDLIAVSVRLQLLRGYVETDAPRALELLEEVRRDVHEALERVRELAGDVYPSLLATWGLSDSLKEAARASEVPIRVVTTGVGRYPPETESAIYFCCRSALDRAAPNTELRLTEENGAVRFEFVAADGADLMPVRDLVEAAGGALDAPPDARAVVVATIALR